MREGPTRLVGLGAGFFACKCEPALHVEPVSQQHQNQAGEGAHLCLCLTVLGLVLIRDRDRDRVNQ